MRKQAERQSHADRDAELGLEPWAVHGSVACLFGEREEIDFTSLIAPPSQHFRLARANQGQSTALYPSLQNLTFVSLDSPQQQSPGVL